MTAESRGRGATGFSSLLPLGAVLARASERVGLIVDSV
jgi:hypothetical protein